MSCPVCNDTGKSVSRTIAGTGGVVLRPCPACAGAIAVQAVPKENETMSTIQPKQSFVLRTDEEKAPRRSTARSVGEQVGKAFLEAGKARVGREVNGQLVRMVKHALGDRIPQNNPMVDAGLAVALPVALLYMTEAIAASGHQAVPRALLEGVNQTSEYALAGVSQDMVDTVVTQALPMLQQVAALSAGLMMQQLDEGGQSAELSAGYEATE
jgi:hypothetical protein